MSTPFFVSRQCYWPTGDLIVEIAMGGMDYANPDMLCSKFPGEAEEYADPREAAKAAIEVARLWKEAEPDKEISVASGYTGGCTLPFEPSSCQEITDWAEELYDKMEKCDVCGELLGSEVLTDEFGDFKFCGEHCAEKWEEQTT